MSKEYTAIVKKWFDKVNGNTYHSVRVIRHSDNAVLCCPFQYGYGEQYRQTALEAMLEAGWLKNYKRKPDGKPSMRVDYTRDDVYGCFERENDYPIIWTVSEGLKRDCVANGKE